MNNANKNFCSFYQAERTNMKCLYIFMQINFKTELEKLGKTFEIIGVFNGENFF